MSRASTYCNPRERRERGRASSPRIELRLLRTTGDLRRRYSRRLGVAGNGCQRCVHRGRAGLPPDRPEHREIESIEIVKGPSAATLYGTQAAKVSFASHETRAVGPRSGNAWIEGGLLNDRTDYRAPGSRKRRLDHRGMPAVSTGARTVPDRATLQASLLEEGRRRRSRAAAARRREAA